MSSSSVKALYFPPYEKILDFLQKHPSTCNEPMRVQQLAARSFNHYHIQKTKSEIQIRINDIVLFQLVKLVSSENDIDKTCEKLKEALEDCLLYSTPGQVSKQRKLMSSSSVKALYFPPYEKILDFLQKHPSTCNESMKVQQLAARSFDHYHIKKTENEIQIRINDVILFQLVKLVSSGNDIDKTCEKLKKALEDCVRLC